MTRKHYKAIAKIVKESSERTFDENYKQSYVISRNTLIDELCIIFKQDNARFNKDKFVEACKK